MLCYVRIGISESIDLNKTITSKECIIWHYWYFLGEEFELHSSLCNGFHDVLMSIVLKSIAI